MESPAVVVGEGAGAKLADQLDEALALHRAEHHPIVSEAWRRRSLRCERMLIRWLLVVNEPVEHGGRLYAIDVDGSLRVSVLEDESEDDGY